MRIRKHASNILGTASSLLPPQSPPPLRADVSSSGYICVLNQSPWDVAPSPPTHNPQNEDSRGDWIKREEPIFAVTSRTTVMADNELPNKPNPALTLKKVKMAKGRRVTVEKAKEDNIRSAAWDGAPTYTCKKTDGKQWRCRRSAFQPNSLCDHHLEQIRSYNCKTPSDAKAASVGKSTLKKRVTMPTSTLAASDIYYCCRGKHPGGGDTMVVDADGRSDREKESYDNMDAGDYEESLEDGELGHSNSRMGCRKMRRKPVKSRSVKSLMQLFCGA